jgi:glutaredoxin-related protein
MSIPAINDEESNVNLHKINPATRNTAIVYNDRKVKDKIVNFTPSAANLKNYLKLLTLQNSIKRIFHFT